MIPMCRKCRFQKRIHQEIHRQDLTQVDRNLITIRELNYLLSDRMFARRRFKNEKEQLLRALLGDDEGWGFAWFYNVLHVYVIQYYIQYILGRS